MATSDARAFPGMGYAGECQEILLPRSCGNGSPRQPMYRRRETKLVAKGHETSFIGHRN